MGARDTGDAGDAMIPDGTLFNEQSATNDPLKGTKAFLARPFPTLGERLTREAQRIASRRIPVFPWLGPLEATMEHLASLPVSAQERFQRIEALPSGYSIGALTAAGLTPGVALYSGEARTSLPGGARAGGFSHSQQASLTSGWQASRAHNRSTPIEEGSPKNFSKSTMASDPTGQSLPPHLQQRLRSFVGPGTESIRIHNDAASHVLARAHRADAVTIGQHIFFREGQFHTRQERGFALLTHEALHVVRAMQPGSAWRRATQAGIQEEEQEAAAVESRALAARRNALWEPTPQPLFPAQSAEVAAHTASSRIAGSTPIAAGSIASVPAQRPMKASADRSLDNGAAAPAMPDMDALKRSLYRDLMRQIKADLERGG